MLCLIQSSHLSHNVAKERPIRLWVALLMICGMIFLFSNTACRNAGENMRLDEQFEYAAITNDLAGLKSIWDSHQSSAAKLADVRSHLGPALRAAACAGDDDAVKQLLQWGADPNSASLAGKTPLMCTAGSAHSGSIARQLLSSGANASARDHRGQTPVDVAIATHDIGLIASLKFEFPSAPQLPRRAD